MIGKEQDSHIYLRPSLLPPPLLDKMHGLYASVTHLDKNFDLVITKLVPRRVKETGSRWV